MSSTFTRAKWILLLTLQSWTSYMLNQGFMLVSPGGSKLEMKCVCSSKHVLDKYNKPWLIYSPAGARNYYYPPTSLSTSVAAHCKSNLLLEIFGHGLSSVALRSIFKKTLTLTLFSSIKQVPDSWDDCHVFAVGCSPSSTWTWGTVRSVRHTRVQLLDCHITTDCWKGLLAI